MSKISYRIEDEPRPSTLSHIVVHPLWPLLAVMFGGVWISWPWFLFNGFAVGSPTRWREITWVVVGLIGGFLFLMVLSYLHEQKYINTRLHLDYAMLLLVVWKLAVSYVLYTLQSRSIHIFEHYGGTLKNGIFIVIAATLLEGRIFDKAAFGLFWVLLS